MVSLVHGEPILIGAPHYLVELLSAQMRLFKVYLACVGWCTDVPESRVRSLYQSSTTVDQRVLTDVLAYLVVRCAVQKPIWTKSGQPMLGLGVRLALGLDYLSHECVAALPPSRSHWTANCICTCCPGQADQRLIVHVQAAAIFRRKAVRVRPDFRS